MVDLGIYFEKIEAEYQNLLAEKEKIVGKTNKAAKQRARKITVNLEKIFKEFRKMSLIDDTDSDGE